MVKKLNYTKLGKRILKKEKSLTLNQIRFLDGISEAVREINLHKQGKIKMQTLKEFLEELKQEGYF